MPRVHRCAPRYGTTTGCGLGTERCGPEGVEDLPQLTVSGLGLTPASRDIVPRPGAGRRPSTRDRLGQDALLRDEANYCGSGLAANAPAKRTRAARTFADVPLRTGLGGRRPASIDAARTVPVDSDEM